jgi:hypothetical protein
MLTEEMNTMLEAMQDKEIEPRGPHAARSMHMREVRYGDD